MKRIVFNKLSVPSSSHSNSKGLWVRVNRSGAMTFSKEISDKMELVNTGVNFIQDEDRPADWYLEPTDDGHAFTARLKKSNKHDHTCVIQCAAIAKKILEAANVSGELKSARFMIAGEPVQTTLYAIITKSANLAKRETKKAA